MEIYFSQFGRPKAQDQGATTVGKGPLEVTGFLWYPHMVKELFIYFLYLSFLHLYFSMYIYIMYNFHAFNHDVR